MWCVAAWTTAAAQTLPQKLTPDEPFPRIEAEAPFHESIAPGITYARYRLVTAAGPMEICVVAVAPQHPYVKIDTVLASDAITSRGETLSSMAHRTGAVAGINADYYDIGATNRPTNIVVTHGTLMHTPRARYQLIVGDDGLPRLVESNFTGEIDFAGGASVALDAVNEMAPPHGGVSLLTPQFGPVAPEQNITLIPLVPAGGTLPFGTFTTRDPADNLSRQPPGYYLAVGENAYGKFPIPEAGASIRAFGEVSADGVKSVVSAAGGGPLILHEGRWYDDPDGPSGGEYGQRIPSSGVAIAPDGTMFLVEVDGRQGEYSVGVTRREFAALMRSLGAIEGMAFDGGGSSELVVRRLGDPDAQVATSPSDGRERDIADGVLIYSTAPVGEPVRLISRPLVARVVHGAAIPLVVSAIDANGHTLAAPGIVSASVFPQNAGVFRNGSFIATGSGDATIALHSGALHGETHVQIVDAPERIVVTPANVNLDAHGSAQFSVRAYDRSGYPLVLPETAAWSASSGNIDSRGHYVAGDKDATLVVRFGGKTASAHVSVGSHSEPLAFAQTARFATVPPGGDGELTREPGCDRCIDLAFVVNAQFRAAYALAQVPLPKTSVGLEFDLHDDGDRAHVKLALRNAINEQILLPVTVLDHPGWRHVSVRFPAGLAEPLRLESIYVLHDGRTQQQQGTIIVRNVRVLLAGS